MKDLFTTGEAAEIVRVSQQTIINCFDAGRLEGFRVPGSRFRRIPRQSLIKFMKDNNLPLDAIESGKRKVLIVDDDVEIVELIVDVLDRDGRFETKTASSGYEAGIATERFRPELIILNLDVPDVIAKKLCECIHANVDLESTKIIFVSHKIQSETIRELQDTCVAEFIQSPFSSELLLARVCNLLKFDIGTEYELKDSSLNESKSDLLIHITPSIQEQYVEMRLTIERDFDSFSQDDEELFLVAIQHILDSDHGVSFVRKERGSTRLIIEVTLKQAEQLLWLYERGVLDRLNVTEAEVIGNAAANAIIKDKIETNTYDVFMCYDSKDEYEVERLALRLRKHGILPWLDKWEIRPGMQWQHVLEKQISTIKSAMVLIGNLGMGPWQDLEKEAFIRQFVIRNCPIIPVLLKSCPCKPTLPELLNGFAWVDLKKRKPDPMQQLVWGITGNKPQTPP